MTYPRLQTIYDRNHHQVVRVTYKEGEQPVEVCGYTWCEGGCGHPALIIPLDEEPHYKCHGDMVAFGPTFQRFRVKWTGPTVEVPEEHRADFLKRYWT